MMDQAIPASHSYPAILPAKSEGILASPSVASKTDVEAAEEPPRKKQKRNKPTLSCEECVERKTKVS